MDKLTLWTVIVALGVGSYGLRFAFLGLVGGRPLPAWLMRHLRYTAVAILPAMCAPLVMFSNATETGPDPARLAAAAMTLAMGAAFRNVFAGLFAGAITLGLWLTLLG